MNRIIAAIQAAAEVLAKAAYAVRQFTIRNTPESALLAAIAFAFQQYQAGTITGPQFAIAVFSALVAFVITESAKDAKEPAA
jgi:hypothetical protein